MSSQKWAVLAVIALMGCGAPVDDAPPDQVGLISLGEISTGADGRCFARQDGVTQTTVVTELVEVEPAVRDRNGVVVTPAIFRNITRPQTVQVAEGAPFETVCPQIYTPDFVATLQRALIVRRGYDGDVTGLMDEATSVAVQRFQRDRGIDSPLLEIGVARELGLVAIPR